ncbi:MAG: hypothetical protein AMXMBFR83_11110 [Phycisphaerae bacterium]|jgi:hypothetical protein
MVPQGGFPLRLNWHAYDIQNAAGLSATPAVKYKISPWSRLAPSGCALDCGVPFVKRIGVLELGMYLETMRFLRSSEHSSMSFHAW